MFNRAALHQLGFDGVQPPGFFLDHAIEQLGGLEIFALGDIQRSIRIAQRATDIGRILAQKAGARATPNADQGIRQAHGLAQLHQRIIAGRDQRAELFGA